MALDDVHDSLGFQYKEQTLVPVMCRALHPQYVMVRRNNPSLLLGCVVLIRMRRVLTLVSCMVLFGAQHGTGSTSLCWGPGITFLGSCYRFLPHRMDFWGAQRSCMACRGGLAIVSDGPVLAFLAQHLNQSSRWWVGHGAKGPDAVGNGSRLTASCRVLVKSGLSVGVQDTTCVDSTYFICQKEGQSCSTGNSHMNSMPRSKKGVQSIVPPLTRCFFSSIPMLDLLDMANKLINLPMVKGNNLSELLTDINTMVLDEEETSIAQLLGNMSLLNKLSERIQYPDVTSTDQYANLSSVVYFGVNFLLQSVLSTCFQIPLTSQQKQSLTTAALDILQNMQNGVLSNQSLIGTGVFVQTPVFSLQLTSLNSSDLGQGVLSFPNNTNSPAIQAVFPSLAALNSSVNTLQTVQVQMMNFVQNPFLSNSSSSVAITGPVASLNFMSGVQKINLHNLSDNFQIFLPKSTSQITTPTQVQTSMDSGLHLSLVVSPLGSTLVIIVKVTHGVPIQLYYGMKSVAEVLETQESDVDSHTWIFTPEQLLNTTSLQTFFVCPTNSSGTKSVQMTTSSFVASCAFWDAASEQWRSDGCKVGPKTSLEQVQCLCNHLSFFGSSFLVLPVQIDVTRTADYFSHISENPVIVVLLACFYACYIATVIWARRMDLRDQTQSRVNVLRDNDPCALYSYRIAVFTGHRRGAATSAKVFLSLCGSGGQCGPVLLTDTKHGVFQSGSIDIFLLTTPFPLGDLHSITLSHDGTGARKSWYVTQVTAQDMQLKKTWHFLCNTWLSLPPKGESLSKVFPAANVQELTSFRNIFFKKTLRGLRDEHIWISVLNHPARSKFTRVQRVSCCMCLLLCTIVINLMFWEMPQANYPVLISIGSFSLTWKDFMIAFESAFLMFPVNLLIIFIFRNTRPKDSGEPETKTKKGAKVPVSRGTKKNIQSRRLCATSVIEDLEKVAQTLNHTCHVHLELEMKLEPSHHIGSLLEIISHMLHKQAMPGTSTPLAQLPMDELQALFCAHYICRKLRRVHQDLGQLGSQGFQDKQQYDDYLAQLQTLIHLLDTSVPPLPIQRSSQKQSVPKKRKLPWWFLLIGWALLLSISAVSTFFTMLYGFKYGKESSIRWIISMLLSLFQSIFVLQPLKVVGFAVFFALVLKKVEMEEEEEDLLDVEPSITGHCQNL
ncbi:polycystin-1-like protein 2 [Pelodytes ibericus]